MLNDYFLGILGQNYCCKIRKKVLLFRWLRLALGFTFGLWISAHILTERIFSYGNGPFKVPGPKTLCSSSGNSKGPIIYIESSGEECLTPRQACGIESAARANPSMDIRIYSNTAKLGRPAWDSRVIRHGRVRSCALNKLLLTDRHFDVNKIQFIRRNFEEWLPKFDGSTFKLHHFDQMKKSPYWIVQLSDAARLILLEKYGGIYLDFDNIIFRSLHCLRNTLSYLQEELHIENGIMMMNANHPFLQFLLEYAAKNYDPNDRISLGPPTLGKAFKVYCKQSGNSQFQAGNFTYCDVNLIHPDAFFPIKHYENEIFYSVDSNIIDSFDSKTFERAFMTHVYLSSWDIKVNSKSLYARLASHYCPTVWQWSSTGGKIPLGF